MSSQDSTSRESYRPRHYSRNTSLSYATNQVPIISLMQQKLPLVWIRTLCQRLTASPCPTPVFLVCKCLSCGHVSSDLVSPKRLVLAPVPTTVARHRNHHKASLSKRCSSCRNYSSEVATAVFSCMCPEASSTSDSLEPAESDGPNEAWRNPKRSQHTKTSGRGTTSRRRVMSTTSSASPCGLAFHELLVLHNVSIPAGTPCPAYLGYQKTKPANSRALPDFGCKSENCSFSATQMTTALTMYSNAQHMFGVPHTDGPHARVSPILETRRWPPRFRRCLQGWKLLTPGRTNSFSPIRVSINRNKTGLGGSTARHFWPNNLEVEKELSTMATLAWAEGIWLGR